MLDLSYKWHPQNRNMYGPAACHSRHHSLYVFFGLHRPFDWNVRAVMGGRPTNVWWMIHPESKANKWCTLDLPCTSEYVCVAHVHFQTERVLA
jgi:hypothetical protein